jgi:hypothetical protein
LQTETPCFLKSIRRSPPCLLPLAIIILQCFKGGDSRLEEAAHRRRLTGRPGRPRNYLSISCLQTLSSSLLEEDFLHCERKRCFQWVWDVFSFARISLSCLALKGKRGWTRHRGGVLIVPIPIKLRSAGNAWTSFSGPSSGPVRRGLGRGSILRDFQSNVVAFTHPRTSVGALW